MGPRTPDYLDTDSDGDGIPDQQEVTHSGDDDGCAVVPPAQSAPMVLYVTPLVFVLWRAARSRRRGAGGAPASVPGAAQSAAACASNSSRKLRSWTRDRGLAA